MMCYCIHCLLTKTVKAPPLLFFSPQGSPLTCEVVSKNSISSGKGNIMQLVLEMMMSCFFVLKSKQPLH